MKDPLENELRELGWRQHLADAGQAALREHLTAHPEAKSDWEAELELTKLIEKLPDAPPVASNFAALVMQAIERESAAKARSRSAGIWQRLSSRVWWARAAMACAIVGVSCIAFYQHQIVERRMMAENVAKLAEAFSAAGPASTQDFEPIRRLGVEAPAKPDTELIALMK